MKSNFEIMFRPVMIAILVGSVCAFWGADSDNYGDSPVDDYRDSFDDYRDNFRKSVDDLYDNDSDDSFKRRFMRAGFGSNPWVQQRTFGFQTQQRRQQFPSSKKRMSKSGARQQRQNSRSTFQQQPQRRPQTQSVFNNFRRPVQNSFQQQRNIFDGGNNFAHSALMYNTLDAMDFF